MNSKKLNAAKKMPPVFHKLPGENYSAEKSECLNWIKNQTDLLEYIWEHLRVSKIVRYDSKSGKWSGVDYEK